SCISPSSLLSSVFFFSSRRRHTSSKRDWSSDVCSSDLCLIKLYPGEVHISFFVPKSFWTLNFREVLGKEYSRGFFANPWGGDNICQHRPTLSFYARFFS